MTMTQTGRRMALVGLLALIAAMFPLTGASAQGGDVTLDLEGESNVEYAIAWSQQAYPAAAIEAGEGPTRALIGRDDLFPDNLASGVLQDDAALLLTATEALSIQTMVELNRLDVTDVTILGNADAVDPAVEDQLTQQGFTVDRLGGLTRIETAIAIAQDDRADTTAVDPVPDTTAILARAYPSTDDGTQAFADSLAAGAWAAAEGYDVLLTETDVLTGNTADYLAEAGYEQIIIVGGTEAISADVETAASEFAGVVTRIGGATRFETAVLIANERGYQSSAEADVTLLVDGQAGDAWADGFPLANLSALGDYPVVLANSADTGLPAETTDFLVDDGVDFVDHLSAVDVICGSSVPDNDTVANQCVEAAEETGTTVVTVPLLGDGTAVQTGTVTAIDTANDTVTFVDDGGVETTAFYDVLDDTFVVDGAVATVADFEAAATAGDIITVTDNGDASSTFTLDNAAP